ncbi:MAG TPA: L-aspartate oxidase [Candidatus Nanopelagicales bacterium]|nr:L-aspartate oxidase [Candidatus Nanopelagicales bacterium]
MTIRLPQRLTAPAPGWTLDADVVVIGSGVAGLTTALHARAAGYRVLLVTKARVDAGSTRWAQGGIAAALADDDSPAEHELDTLVAGAGLCDPVAVRALVTEGPGAVRRLIELGARFDTDESGDIALTREGGHLRDRIAHAGGDATGAEISRALVAAVEGRAGIELIENALALDLLLDDRGAVQGVTLHVMGEGARDGVGAVLAPAVVLATGGLGQVFSSTTNPSVATGDGMALALRAGAAVADLEFVQFHPTVLWLGEGSTGQQPLVSEAVRGEGAVLRDDAGVRFMEGQHPLADLAPRDVVAKGIMRRMRETGAKHVWLDAREFGTPMWEKRFPTILASLRQIGVDPTKDLIPVAPAQHYASGGARTDVYGRTSVRGLYAVGECACTGVHGANRLASNSLLEGLVFASRIGDVLAEGLPERRDPVAPRVAADVLDPGARKALQAAMTEGVGVLRSRDSMSATLGVLSAIGHTTTDDPHTRAWETTNLHAVATVLAANAKMRKETRGSHWREDFPDTDDEHWHLRLVSHLDPDGVLVTEQEPVPQPQPWPEENP